MDDINQKYDELYNPGNFMVTICDKSIKSNTGLLDARFRDIGALNLFTIILAFLDILNIISLPWYIIISPTIIPMILIMILLYCSIHDFLFSETVYNNKSENKKNGEIK